MASWFTLKDAAGLVLMCRSATCQTEGTHRASLEIPMCHLDLTGGGVGAVLPSDPKRNKPWKMVNFLESVAGPMFNVFLSTQSKTHSILGQKEVKESIGEEEGCAN